MLLTTLSNTGTPAQNEGEIRLIFAGDIMCHQTQLISAFDSISQNYSFESYFDEIKPLIASADIAIANLETTFPGEDYSGYPEFGSPDKLAEAIVSSGFTCLVTANNHSLDKGLFGLERTNRLLNQHRVLHTGTFVSPEEKELLSPLIMNANGFKIALINYSYGLNYGHLKSDYPINIIDTTAIREDIIKSKKANADFIICFLHWGKEYESSPSDKQKQLANWLHDKGVQLVIGSHPHVVQPVNHTIRGEVIESLTAFSLGNLISNQRSGSRKQGLILEVILRQINDKLQIVEYIKHPTYVSRVKIDENGKYNYRITLPSSPSPTSQTAGL